MAELLLIPVLLIPVWHYLHPMMIHFPIVLLLVSPLFMLLAALLPPLSGRPYSLAALMLLALGTASLFVSVAAGSQAAVEAGAAGPAVSVLQAHAHLASETKYIFLGLLAIYLGVILLPALLNCRDSRLFTTLLPLSFLILYAAGAIFLVRTADTGARLVHQFGIRAPVPAPASAPPAIHANRSNLPRDSQRLQSGQMGVR